MYKKGVVVRICLRRILICNIQLKNKANHQYIKNLSSYDLNVHVYGLIQMGRFQAFSLFLKIYTKGLFYQASDMKYFILLKRSVLSRATFISMFSALFLAEARDIKL